ncbi:MAG: hypothetical protein HQK51_09695 [Oligoflexia bacterium]|nr:hypothetical protein [Oligoflexia bacterium]
MKKLIIKTKSKINIFVLYICSLAFFILIGWILVFPIIAYSAPQTSITATTASDIWATMDANLKGLYKTLTAKHQKKIKGKQAPTTEELFATDVSAIQSNRRFHCDYPYKYTLLKKAVVITSEEALEREKEFPCNKNRIIPIRSTDTSVMGRPFFLANLDPAKIQRIAIGKNKSGTFNFGHSYAVMEVCVQQVPCDKPLEVAVHPGADNNHNLQLDVRGYSDTIAVKHLKGLDVDEVDLDTSTPGFTQNFVDALYERFIRKDSQYDIFDNNCSTNVDELVQFASMKSFPNSSPLTPEEALDKAKAQFKKQKEKVLSPIELANKNLKNLLPKKGLFSKQTTMDGYKKLKAEDRYCNRKNKKGIQQEIDEISKKMAITTLTKSLEGGELSTLKIRQKSCDDLGKKLAELMTKVAKCKQVENALLFDKKLELNKKIMDAQSVVKEEAQVSVKEKAKGKVKSKRKALDPDIQKYATNALKLEKLREEGMDLLQQAIALVKWPSDKSFLTKEEFAQAIDSIKQSTSTQQLINKMDSTAVEIEALNKTVKQSFYDLLGVEDAQKQLPQIPQKYADQFKGVMEKCSSFCPLQPINE